ncbi:exodeoxyribonuclease III [Candidatus Parabeggiatoa sp. HSG14]|uniref:exodeoxyribonuclease III n=1 Tax=Candidatus Parabeggiatoa sp. HSG14 TaxID=3055593 RepID=UPI0025A8F842|nr:exodeoxyribonuclease III [Thiotrichales bacterium HSG14]
MLKIATWNVNSLRVRLLHVLDWLQNHKPDILALQEIKMTDAQFPIETIQEIGYHAIFSGQKTYNGVALLSRLEGNDIVTDLPLMEDPQRRVLGATYNSVRVLNLYVPNGEAVGSEKYYYKLNWLKHLHDYVRESLKNYSRLIVLGDFNIAPDDRDLYDPAVWKGRILVSELERNALKNLLDLGLSDTFRLFEQPPASFSWWDYRAGSFQRNRGVRIDLILASKTPSSDCITCTIDTEPRSLERPSDHTPVVATFNFSEKSKL